MKSVIRKVKRLIDQNRFLALIIGAIVLAIVWVVISVTIYIRDGTHLLDLSRPGYEPVREQVRQETQSEAFSADGAIDAATLEDFLRLYRERTGEINQFDNFNSTALDESQLRINP